MADQGYGQVLGHTTRDVDAQGHERATHAWVCSEIARLLGIHNAGLAGEATLEQRSGHRTLHVPDETVTTERARAGRA